METREYEIHELEAEIEHLEMVLESKDKKIKKLEVEIQRLKAPINNWLVKGLSKEQLEKEKIQAWKAEAVKEFAKRLKEEISKEIYTYWNDIGGGYYLAEDVLPDINNLVKEMVGEG